MTYQVILQRPAEKELGALEASVHKRIVTRLLALEENPRPTGVKKLQGQESYRLRVGTIEFCTPLTTKQKKYSSWRLDIAAKCIVEIMNANHPRIQTTNTRTRAVPIQVFVSPFVDGLLPTKPTSGF